jgi:hypothetical protein
MTTSLMDTAVAPSALIPQCSLLSPRPNRRAIIVMARARLRAGLRSIVFDVLGLVERGDLPAETAAWVESAADVAAAAVCDTSVSTLLVTIDASLAQAPVAVRAELADSAIRHNVGIE